MKNRSTLQSRLRVQSTVLSVFALLTLICSIPREARAQVSVQDSISVADLVSEILLGDSIGVSNITYNGEDATGLFTAQMASFTVDSSAFPIADGVLMSTGNVQGIMGGSDNTVANFQNDPDLLAIAGVQQMNNCGIIEFDFTAQTDTFLIDYVFASREYPSFTCSNFNDAFGLFLSGPGIQGPFSNNAVNLALIPNTDIPVAINTVNGGVPSNFQNFNTCLQANPNFVEDSIYFFKNDPVLQNSIAYPGHTHMLTAFAVLMPGETYHFKLAIGNAMDQALQSAVLMRRGSASGVNTTGLLTMEVNTAGIDVAQEGIFVAGTFNYFVPEPMELVSPNMYRFAALVAPYTNVTYKFFNGNGPDAAELIPDDCAINGLMPAGSRHLSMPPGNLVMEPVCFGTCEVCASTLSTAQANENKLKLYPNPNDGHFQVQVPMDGQVRVQAYDIQGKMVFQQRTYVQQGAAHGFALPSGLKGLFHLQFDYENQPELRFGTKVVVH